METDKEFLSNMIRENIKGLLPSLENIYIDLHSHPELSMQEHRTAGIAASHLQSNGYEVTTGIGKTGVVGILRNGDGPTVMLRADMDALPMQEQTDLPYASQVTHVAHTCGHDMHITWLLGATTWFANNRDLWKGTIMAVFQPGEETGEGAKSMIQDGLFERFSRPDVILGQHVMVGPSGTISGKAGVVTSIGDSMMIHMFGRGAHGSMPQSSIDPVVMAASTVLRLQTIVSRELAATEAAVLTIGSIQAGTKENIIPDEAILKINIRTFDESVRERVLSSVKRIVLAEASASGSPREPEFKVLDHYPMVRNDFEATRKVVESFRRFFSDDKLHEAGPTSASEDFGCFGIEWGVPSVFWFVGGTDTEVYNKAQDSGRLRDLPTNHHPKFAPVLHPTLESGVLAMISGAMGWLSK